MEQQAAGQLSQISGLSPWLQRVSYLREVVNQIHAMKMGK
jgi:hypothetical protein